MSRFSEMSNQVVGKLFGNQNASKLRRRRGIQPRRSKSRTLRFEQLDRREVLSGNGLTVVLDPGHGIGNTLGGSTGVESRVPERDLTLDMARRVKSTLDRWGFSTTLTRNNEYDVDFYTRSRTAQVAAADFFLSLHFDGLPNGGRGTTAYVRRDGNVNVEEDTKFADAVRLATLQSYTRPNDLGTRIKNASEVPIGVLDDAVFGNTATNHPVASTLLEIESLGNIDVDRFFNNSDLNLRNYNRQSVANRIAEGIWRAKQELFDNARVTAPTSFSATANSPTQVTLNWSDVNRESGYRIYSYFGGLLGTVGANANQYEVNGLAAGQNHWFRIEAFNASSTASTHWRWVATPNPTVTAPSWFTTTATSPSQVTLNWSDVNNETGYRILNQDGALVANLGANATSFTVNGLTGGRNYGFRVEAFNTGSSKTTGWSWATTPYPQVSAPSWLSVSATGGSRVNVYWGDVADETGYRVYIWQNGRSSLLATVGPNTQFFQTGLLARNQTYWFIVAAFNPSSTAYTNWQSVWIP